MSYEEKLDWILCNLEEIYLRIDLKVIFKYINDSWEHL